MPLSDLIEEWLRDPESRRRIAHVRSVAPRTAVWAEPAAPLSAATEAMLSASGIGRLYSHQAAAIDLVRSGSDVMVTTGPASGKSLCYAAPLIEMLEASPLARALLVFPTKALCQDQQTHLSAALQRAGMSDRMVGVYDGDTPSAMRRRLRDDGAVLLTNPDMLHAGLMSQHGRWATFLANTRLIVLDEAHVYSGLFGSNMANVIRRLDRLWAHYGASPQIVACSATIGNPAELATRLLRRRMAIVDGDGSPSGTRTIVLWNPPVVRGTRRRSRRSANVEAQEMLVRLVRAQIPCIVFSKAKMTAELICRYVQEALRSEAPHLASRVTAYRGGYLAEERRDIERRLFAGELICVSTTPALELGIDVGSIGASVIVGYPGTRASFFQQSGRAGRGLQDGLTVLVGLDTPANQYIMRHPEYILGKPIENITLDPDNPFILSGHLRCAAHELPIREGEVDMFGPAAPVVLEVLTDNLKLRQIGAAWHHAASETPHHETPLRGYSDGTVAIEDADTGRVVAELNRYDAEPIIHPDAVYLHGGDTYRVLSLDMVRNVARVVRDETAYYTQPVGGTDVHHVDNALRSKAFGSSRAFFGEVTAYFRTVYYEKVRFYELDTLSTHGVDLPPLVLETMAFWIIPPEQLMADVLRAGMNPHTGLRGIGYATRMLLPLFVTCDTPDLSHSIGSANTPWNALFVYEHHPLGLGVTERAYDMLHQIMPAVRCMVASCRCRDGCPCCVGKPLRGHATWNVERGEGSIPSKRAALAILDGILSGVQNAAPDDETRPETPAEIRYRVERALRRHAERLREPSVFHPVERDLPVGFPDIESSAALSQPDADVRRIRRSAFDAELRRRLRTAAEDRGRTESDTETGRTIVAGDRLAARARSELARGRSENREAES